MHRPLHCILPPQLLARIALAGDPDQRARALATLSTDTTLRTLRLQTPVPVRRRPTVAGVEAVQRSIYTAGGLEVEPGTLVRGEGSPPGGDFAVDEAYDGLGATHALYAAAYGRNSLDDEGMPLVATVHYGQDYDNAFWDGAQMVFGDGDGQLFRRFTLAVDVIGHELTHGVTQDEAQLTYLGQAGALNESLSDVFGSLVKQHALGQTAEQADWLIGVGLFTDQVQGVALRSLQAPGTAYDDPVLGQDQQVGHLRDYVETREDNGGVHTNSGIPNRAFFLAATALGGAAWERAGSIWYAALRDPRLRSTASFAAFSAATVRAAQHAYGADAVQAVTQAWRAVGVEPA